MGNRIATISDRVVNKSLGGEIFIRPKLDDKIALTMTFSPVAADIKDDLLALLRDNVGQLFTVTDENGIVYEVIVTNVPHAVAEIRDDCNEFSITLDMMGEVVP
jgi:hypothetical protein